MPTERPVPEERVFLIRLQNLPETLTPPVGIAYILAVNSMRMALLPEIDDDCEVVIELPLDNAETHAVYRRFRNAEEEHGLLRVFNAVGTETRRYAMNRAERMIAERYMKRRVHQVFTAHRSRQVVLVRGVPQQWTFDRILDQEVETRTPEVVLGRVEYEQDMPFPIADWIVEEVTDRPLFCVPRMLQLNPRARR